MKIRSALRSELLGPLSPRSVVLLLVRAEFIVPSQYGCEVGNDADFNDLERTAEADAPTPAKASESSEKATAPYTIKGPLRPGGNLEETDCREAQSSRLRSIAGREAMTMSPIKTAMTRNPPACPMSGRPLHGASGVIGQEFFSLCTLWFDGAIEPTGECPDGDKEIYAANNNEEIT